MDKETYMSLSTARIERANAQRIRNNSDHDDFYIADKAECEKQVMTAREIYQKTLDYIEIFK